MDSAVSKREVILDGETDCCRLIHGSADGFSGITADRFGPAVLVERHVESAPVNALLDAMVGQLGAEQPIFLKERWSRDESRRAGSQVRGVTCSTAQVVREGGLSFEVYLTAGEHVGLFLDARLARARVRALSVGKRVLNLFCYTGGFGVAAAVGGARATTNVDNKRSALDRARENYQRNDLRTDTRTFLRDDAIDYLKRAARGNGRYDMVILDPPPRFRRARGRLFRVDDGYAKLLALAATVLDGNGTIVAGINITAIDDARLRTIIAEASVLSKRDLVFSEFIRAGADFPQGSDRPAARFALGTVSNRSKNHFDRISYLS